MAYAPLKIPGIDTSQTYGGPTVAGFGKQATPAVATSATPYMNIAPQMPKPMVDTTAPIPAASLTSKATTYPAPAQPTVASTALASNLASAYSMAETGIKEEEAAAKTAAEAPPAPADTSLKASLAKILGLSNDLADKSGRAFEIQNEEGVFDKKKNAQNINNEILAKTKFYDKKIEEIRKNPQGKFGQAVEQDVATLERQRNSELADLAIQSKVANDDYKGAFDIAQAKVDAEFEPIQAQIDTLKTYYSLAQNDMTESEKLQAQAEIQKQESALDFERQKELYKYKQQIDQSDPLYQANLSAALGKGGAGGVIDVASMADPNAPSVNNNYTALASIFKTQDISPANKTAIGNGLSLLKAASDLANANASGDFAGSYPLRGVVDFFTPEGAKRSKTVSNEALVSALDLQTQFWASGAALSDAQTALVQKMIPTKFDTDKAIRTKTNQLVNYMLSQTASRLITDGVQFNPSQVNLYEMADLLKEASPEQKAELKAAGLIQ